MQTSSIINTTGKPTKNQKKTEDENPGQAWGKVRSSHTERAKKPHQPISEKDWRDSLKPGIRASIPERWTPAFDDEFA